MGLTNQSIGANVTQKNRCIMNQERIVAIAGNPNVGKSTIFNALTGMKQHTGNWPGKTVGTAIGHLKTDTNSYALIDIPGTYSLLAHSEEEEIARNFICFSKYDFSIVVCDATCLERNLNLALQILEVSPKTIICVNLLDEAKRKNISVDLKKLSSILGVPVIGTIAQSKKTLKMLKTAMDERLTLSSVSGYKTSYPQEIENAISIIEPVLEQELGCLNKRWMALKLLDYDEGLINEINCFYGKNILTNDNILSSIDKAKNYLKSCGIESEDIKRIITSATVLEAEKIAASVTRTDTSKTSFEDKVDRILCSKLFGFPIMLMFFALIFWITITGANYPSMLLTELFSKIGSYLFQFLDFISSPPWLISLLLDGVYKVLTWVVAVMLPPMAIFFPLFTLLEDSGYLPRIAFNLDKPFKCCNACGKQALTMCMGFGCNAAGVVGCRIIDSPRERLIAIITNSLVPCNGRFPALITLITIFFIGSKSGIISSLTAAILLTLIIVSGIAITFAASKLLSCTVLKGVPSSFILELPPYRKPQISKTIIRSIFEKTIFVLGRAIIVAAPAGIIIWLFSNIEFSDATLLSICANALDPLGKLIGLDGVILMAFILGFPANEIVLPIIIMAYLSNGTLIEFDSLEQIRNIFISNGWTTTTALCTIIFSLFHWPCSTTMLTIKKETGSIKWTFAAMVLPTLIGILICFIISTISKIIF